MLASESANPIGSDPATAVTILLGDYVGHEPQIADVLLDRVRSVDT